MTLHVNDIVLPLRRPSGGYYTYGRYATLNYDWKYKVVESTSIPSNRIKVRPYSMKNGEPIPAASLENLRSDKIWYSETGFEFSESGDPRQDEEPRKVAAVIVDEKTMKIVEVVYQSETVGGYARDLEEKVSKLLQDSKAYGAKFLVFSYEKTAQLPPVQVQWI